MENIPIRVHSTGLLLFDTLTKRNARAGKLFVMCLACVEDDNFLLDFSGHYQHFLSVFFLLINLSRFLLLLFFDWSQVIFLGVINLAHFQYFPTLYFHLKTTRILFIYFVDFCSSSLFNHSLALTLLSP